MKSKSKCEELIINFLEEIEMWGLDLAEENLKNLGYTIELKLVKLKPEECM